MGSIERLYCANAYENTQLFNDGGARSTMYRWVDTLGARNRLVGYAWSAIKEAFYCEHAKSALYYSYRLQGLARGYSQAHVLGFAKQPTIGMAAEDCCFE